VGLDAVPMQHPQLDAWCANFTGIRWKDPQTGWTFSGAVDCDRSWIEARFREAVTLPARGVRPAAGQDCAWCTYADRKVGWPDESMS